MSNKKPLERIRHRTTLLGLLCLAAIYCSCDGGGCSERKVSETDDSAKINIVAKSSSASLANPDPKAEYWQHVEPQNIEMTAQPMVVPRPKNTTTSSIRVQALHDQNWLALRLQWDAPDANAGQKLGTFSDAVAVQFPVKSEGTPPPIFMGSAEQPVQIFHWRAMYQLDRDQGFHHMKDIYPNMVSDGYPSDWSHAKTQTDAETLEKLTQNQADAWSIGREGGNPQSYRKPTGVDVILAKGYGSSSVTDDSSAQATGIYENGKWTVVINRPLKNSQSVIKSGERTYVAFAVWQGAKQEAGSRKSVTMAWSSLDLRK